MASYPSTRSNAYPATYGRAVTAGYGAVENIATGAGVAYRDADGYGLAAAIAAATGYGVAPSVGDANGYGTASLIAAGTGFGTTAMQGAGTVAAMVTGAGYGITDYAGFGSVIAVVTGFGTGSGGDPVVTFWSSLQEDFAPMMEDFAMHPCVYESPTGARTSFRAVMTIVNDEREPGPSGSMRSVRAQLSFLITPNIEGSLGLRPDMDGIIRIDGAEWAIAATDVFPVMAGWTTIDVVRRIPVEYSQQGYRQW